MPKRQLNESDLQQSQKRRKDLSQDGGDDKPVAGILRRIELRNFMNHAQLTFDFQPRVNFVTGHNGTGKSAVLTGLVVGLGGKASSTSRGNQITGFIQDGKQVSEIKVTLHNDGAEAFQQDVYGDSIIIERKLVRSGSSDYKIKSSSGKLISTKKQDLTTILDHFNIQIENPVAILNQEVSKNFLFSKNPCDRYKFFMKATQIEQMQVGYKKAEEEFQETLRMLQMKESSLPTMEAELKEAQSKAAALESLDKLKTRLSQKYCELAWAVVNQKEAEFRILHEKLQKHQTDRTKYETKLKEAEEKLSVAESNKKKVEEEIKSMACDTDKLVPQRNELQRLLSDQKKHSRTHQDNVMQFKKELKRLEADKKILGDKIKEIESSSQNDKSAQGKLREQKMEQLNAKLKETEQSLTDLRFQSNKLTHTLTSLREEKQERVSEVSECERIKKSCQQRIADMERSRSNKILRFGKSWPALVDEMEKLYKAGRFKSKPYGPLGAHISIKNMKYALGAERALGALLTAFFVETIEDKKLVEEIKKKVCEGHQGPIVLCGKFIRQRYSITDRAQTHHPTLMDLLDVDDNVVFNALIDEISMQNIIMVEDPVEARELMKRNQPRNSQVCYDSRGDEIRCNPFRVLANRQDRPKVLSANVEEDIKAESFKLKDVSKTLSETNKKLDELSLQIQNSHDKLNTLKGSISNKEKQLRKFTSEIEELNNQKKEEDESGDTDVLVCDLENMKKELEQVKSSLEQAIQKYDQSRGEEQSLEKKLADMASKLRNVNESVEPLKSNLAKADDEIDECTNAKEHYTNILKNFDSKLKQERDDLEKFQKNEVQKNIDVASKMSERIKATKTPDIIEAEIKQLKSRLSKEQELKGDADTIRSRLNDITEKYNEAKNELSQCQLYRKEMTAALKSRQRNLFKIKLATGTFAKCAFATLLHNRNYEGKLDFDHEEQKLDIVVHPPSSQTHDVRDLKGLSGGEKSFSTLCFMMALWRSVYTPFRCMDEFDVFMDMVNRKVSMRMLIEYAKSEAGHQFIFLTPQDTSQLEACNYVHIFRMPDPVRSQKRRHGGDDDDDGAE